jgi:hypothetical protein
MALIPNQLDWVTLFEGANLIMNVLVYHDHHP